jgi:hypothetical protein
MRVDEFPLCTIAPAIATDSIIWWATHISAPPETTYTPIPQARDIEVSFGRLAEVYSGYVICCEIAI